MGIVQIRLARAFLRCEMDDNRGPIDVNDPLLSQSDVGIDDRTRRRLPTGPV